MQRVVITGVGVFSGLGKNRHEFLHALMSEKSAITPITGVNTETLRFKYGAQVQNYASYLYFQEKSLSLLDRFAQFALIAAREAMRDSNLLEATRNLKNMAVITGSAIGGKITEDQAFYQLYHEKKQRSNPTIIPNSMANAAACHIAHEFGIMGPTYNISTACASSTHAIGQAFWLVRHGVVTRAITGGSEAPFSLGQLKAWDGMRIISANKCRPFSTGRDGMILGEGAAMLVLESMTSAIARNACIYAEIVGFGMSADAKHITRPCSKGQRRAIVAALRDARIKAAAIQYIHAHGTGTQMNDKIETETIMSVFGERAQRLAISSTKSSHGHLLGAAGAIETLVTALALKHQKIPPTLNFISKDDACDIPICTKTMSYPFEYALVNSFAFGGLNASLILKSFSGLSHCFAR